MILADAAIDGRPTRVLVHHVERAGFSWAFAPSSNGTADNYSG